MGRRTKIVAKIDLATLLSLRDRTKALAAHGIVEMQAADGIIDSMLSSVVVECEIPVNGSISQKEATRLAKLATEAPHQFIPELVRAVATPNLGHIMPQATKVHMVDAAAAPAPPKVPG